MADIFVRSTDGNDADNGSTWALAKATLAGAAAIDNAGDRIFVSDNHAESSASAQTIALAGTVASPVMVLCGDDSAEPPTALATTGTVTTTGASSIAVTGSGYVYGLTLTAGDGSSAANIQLNQSGNQAQEYVSCNFRLGTSNSGSRILLGAAATSTRARTVLRSCGFRFGSVFQHVALGQEVLIQGGSLLSGGTSPNSMFNHSASPTDAVIDGFDLSNASASIDLTPGGSSVGTGRILFRNMKLPASWSGDLVAAAITVPGARVEMWNCDSADTNYRLWIEDYAGNIKHETTLVKTGGASDGTTPIAWKMVTVADAEYPLNVLRSPEIRSEWIETVGSPVTLTVDILHDSVTALTDAEVWVEVQYLGDASTPMGSFVTDAKASVLAAAANQAASAATWTTTGMGNPNEQKLEVTFTPQQKGVALVTVCAAKASYTLYVDPKAELS